MPWNDMAGARDRLIHHYFVVNLDIVWQIVSVDLAEVASQIQQIEADAFSEED
jgi:uncharacterized protein with HEPN domain